MKTRQTYFSRREFFRLSAGTVAAVALTACAPATPSGGGATAPESKEAVSESAVGTPTKITLLMVDWNEDCQKLYNEQILPKFQEENPGLTVAADYTSWSDLDVKVMTAFAAGLQPDVFQADNVEFGPKYNQRGIIAVLDDLISSTPGAKEKVDDYYPKAITEGASIGGKIVALPHVFDNRALFYRKDFFAEVGLDPTRPPASWDEFRQAAIKLTKRTDDTFERAGWWNSTAQYCFQGFVPLLWQNGGTLLNETHDQCAFNSPEGVEALALWAKLIREDKVGPMEAMTNLGDLSPFTAGQLAMSFSGYGTLLNVQKYNPEVWDGVGVTVLGQKVQASLWYANTFFLSKGKHVPEAWKLLSYLVLDDDNFRKYHEATGGLPPRKSVAASASHITPLHMVLIEDVMNAPGSHTTPAEPFTLEVLERIDEAIQKAVLSGVDPKEALDVAADEGNQIIARYKEQA